MTRYFQNPASGIVHQSNSSGMVADWQSRGFTEVKPVPLDAVVIDGPLPEVVWKHTMQRWETIPDGRGIHSDDHDADWFMERAEEYLAMALHLREHPPVDEAQVQAIARIIHDSYPDSGTRSQNETIARHLVKRGVRVGE